MVQGLAWPLGLLDRLFVPTLSEPRPVPALIGINPTNVADLRRAFTLLRKPRNFKALAQNFLVDVGARDSIIRRTTRRSSRTRST